ncbi:hypothetical protein, partial [Ornithinicoccus halotolerans]|uniref:hypothetical protein n=1 Tax=Ornithinicoccus halotolerans TaxID=1748220 RepID=UPI001885D63B
SYESVYQEAEEDRRRALRELLAFVELHEAPHFDAAFIEYMSPDSKINSLQTYQRIRNYDQLREEFPRIVTAE